MSAEKKALGVAAFSAGNYADAEKYFTEAIEMDPTNHLLFGNRAAVFAKVGNYEKSLADAQRSVEIAPNYAKGYNRVATAYQYLNKVDEAIEAVENGLKACPGDASLTQLGDQLRQSAMSGAIMGLFQQAFARDPSLAQDAEVSGLMQEMQSQPHRIGEFMQDPRMRRVASVALSGMTGPDQAQAQEGVRTCPRTGKPCGCAHHDDHECHCHEAPRSAPEPTPAPAAAPQPEPEPLSEEEKLKQEADAVKDEGNKLYKARQFDEAIAKYDAAISILDLSAFHLNKAAVFMTMDRLEEAMAEAKEAERIAWDRRDTPLQKNKCLTRIGAILEKMDRLPEAIDMYNKAQLEHREKTTLAKLRAAEKRLRVWKEEQYKDPEKAAEAKAEGNRLFSAQDYPAAIKAFTEAIKRDPSVAIYYSNRAACYLKLMEYRLAEQDCEKALEIDPNAVKALLRMGRAQFLTKRYHKSLDTFQKAAALDGTNQEVQQGLNDTAQQIMRLQTGQMPADEVAMVREASLQDQEVKDIVEDPAMAQILQSMANPQAMQEHMKNPLIAAKISRLIAAGMVQTGSQPM
ncbi:TPR repeat [Carpediemonas membranifera]|uniref:TPR repeat n=1 Tax=Carpediemonas membranifera TaxID=201153 RepID=A0A8J6B6G7_9EUKA|nr:TPR repeat [Carpediemonas membranifera]|eukprot:KAG9395269.1 TPR repeat [Carpediemonas membranifera]